MQKLRNLAYIITPQITRVKKNTKSLAVWVDLACFDCVDSGSMIKNIDIRRQLWYNIHRRKRTWEDVKMIADLLDSGLYEIENKTPANEDNPLEKLRLRYLPVASECPKCKSSNFIKKTASTRTIIDVLGNQPIEITVVKQRYKCSCGKLSLLI